MTDAALPSQDAGETTPAPVPASSMAFDDEVVQAARQMAGLDRFDPLTRAANGPGDRAERPQAEANGETIAAASIQAVDNAEEAQAAFLRGAAVQGERVMTARNRFERVRAGEGEILSTRGERMAAAAEMPTGMARSHAGVAASVQPASAFVPEAPAARARWMREILPQLDDAAMRVETASDPAAELFEMEFVEARALRETGGLQAERAYARFQPALPPAMQVVQQLNVAAQDGVERLQIQLHPEELGSLDIELVFDRDRKLSVSISVERPETLELLQRETRQIERLLTQNGLQLEQGLDLAMHRERSGDDGAHPGYRQNPEGFAGHLQEAPGELLLEADAPAPVTRSLLARGFFDVTI
ncbi:MAG: flagellar hook-length control protein FliK [Geminicoccaceae bacterium]